MNVSVIRNVHGNATWAWFIAADLLKLFQQQFSTQKISLLLIFAISSSSMFSPVEKRKDFKEVFHTYFIPSFFMPFQKFWLWRLELSAWKDVFCVPLTVLFRNLSCHIDLIKSFSVWQQLIINNNLFTNESVNFPETFLKSYFLVLGSDTL